MAALLPSSAEARKSLEARHSSLLFLLDAPRTMRRRQSLFLHPSSPISFPPPSSSFPPPSKATCLFSSSRLLPNPRMASFICAALPDSKQESSSASQDVLPSRSVRGNEAAARVLLLFVTVFWGTYGPAVRFVYEQPHPPSPSILTLARKVLSLFFCVCCLPLETSIAKFNRLDEKLASEVDGERYSNQLIGFLRGIFGPEWLAAIELGLWTFLGTACQTEGLENTTATRTGFLLQSVNVLVPILSTFSGVRVKSITWFASFLALLGVTYLSLQSTLNSSIPISFSTFASNVDISKGDVEVLLAAFFYALCTVRLSNYAAKLQAIQLSTKLMAVSTCLAASWVFLDHTGRESWVFPSTNIILAIIFSALVPGTFASFGQTIGQKYVSAAEAQVYFSLQPFFSAVFAAVILKEDVDIATWIGGLILFIAASLVSIDSLSNEHF